MVRVDGRVERCSIFLTEQSNVCENGGGYDETRWWVRVNDGWKRLWRLNDLGAFADITVSLLDEEDPHGAARQYWGDRPAQVYWKSTFQVLAPTGTRFQKRYWTPDFEGARKRIFGMPYIKYEHVYVLVGDECLITEEALERKAKAREAKAKEPRLSAHLLRLAPAA